MSTDVRGATADRDLAALTVVGPAAPPLTHLPLVPPPTLDDLDEQVLALLLRRAELSRQEQRIRRGNGHPTRSLTHENAMTRRYVERLGGPGAEIAVAILALSRWLPGN